LTGGQYLAQVPLHFDAVGVSGTNQYKVKPLALVRTVAPPIVVVLSAEPPECMDEPAGVVDEVPETLEPVPPELPQAASTAIAVTASPTDASHLLTIGSVLPERMKLLI
jgi:hypothetical protein